jgi:hypothetical protein
MKRLFVAFALVLAVALPVRAQQLTLQIQDGRVTLDANGVPARQILDEWAKVGGTKVVGADKMTGGPMTIKVVNMPERQALEIVLRNAAGFMAAERQPSAPPGASAYDRILILATTSAPTPGPTNASRGNPPVTTPGVGNMAGTQRRLPPRPPNLPPSAAENDSDDDDKREQDEQEQAGANPPVFTFPAPGANGTNPNTQIVVPMTGNNGVSGAAAPGAAVAPMITIQPNQNGQPTIYNFVPNSDGSMPPPNGFTVIGAPRPGMIQQPATQPAPGQPAQNPPPPPRQ